MKVYAKETLMEQASTPTAAEKQVDHDAQYAHGAALDEKGVLGKKGGAPNCSQQTGNFAHVAEGHEGLQPMVKTVVLLPGFFQGTIQFPPVGKEINPDAITISSIVAIVLMCQKDGTLRQLPLYRHTFVTSTPKTQRAEHHIFSMFPLIDTDQFLPPNQAIDECFGMHPQNDQQYMFSKAHLRAVISETLPDSRFPWLGFDSKTQQLNAKNPPELGGLISKSDELFNALRAAARLVRHAPAGDLPQEKHKIAPLAETHSKLESAGLMPSWMKSGGFQAPPILASGIGTPAMPNKSTVEAFICKLRLQGFLDIESQFFRGRLDGVDASVIPATAATDRVIRPLTDQLKQYLAGYARHYGQEVGLRTPAASAPSRAQAVPLVRIGDASPDAPGLERFGSAAPAADPVSRMPSPGAATDQARLAAQVDKERRQVGGDDADMAGMAGMPPPMVGQAPQGQVKDEIAGLAKKFGDAIFENITTYDQLGIGEIIKRQETMQSISMKTEVLGMLLAALTGMGSAGVPRAPERGFPGKEELVPDSDDKKKGGGSRTQRRCGRPRNKTQKKK